MKSSAAGVVAFCAVLVGCCIAAACNTRKDYTAEIGKLDSIAVLMDSSITNLKEVALMQTLADSASAHIQTIQENYKGTMPQPMAKTLNLYSIMRKDMVSLATFSQTLRNQTDSGRKQVLDLRQALHEGATHDAKDNKLTEDYVKALVIKEEKSANELLNLAKQQTEKSVSIGMFYTEIQPQIKMWADSLQMNAVK